MKTLPLAALLAVTALGWPSGWPKTLPDRWLHNPRERTAKGIEEWQRKQFAAADRHLEQALELGDETPRALFNAGTGRLGAGTPGAALPLLGRAAEAAAKDPSMRALQPEALYNLGNAYLAADDADNAVESYRAALRLQPGHQAAKHNLELALREQQKNEQPPNDPQQQGQGGGDEQQQQQQPQQGGAGQEGEQPPQPQPQAPQPPQQGQGRPSPRLPGFNPQKDMSAEQAASLLEAIENLEREQRRARAEQQRRDRARAATEKDW